MFRFPLEPQVACTLLLVPLVYPRTMLNSVDTGETIIRCLTNTAFFSSLMDPSHATGPKSISIERRNASEGWATWEHSNFARKFNATLRSRRKATTLPWDTLYVLPRLYSRCSARTSPPLSLLSDRRLAYSSSSFYPRGPSRPLPSPGTSEYRLHR